MIPGRQGTSIDLRTRRQVLRSAACGFGSLALGSLLGQELAQASGSTRSTSESFLHHRPRAKRIIFIFMQGGPSQVDLFQHKPQLAALHGRELDFRVARTRATTPERVMRSPWEFSRHGECGQTVSELFPEVARHVDKLCFIHSMHTNGVAHGPATLFLHTGSTNFVRPSMGAWITYGLGTENDNLPAYLTINPSMGNGGPRNWSNAFLPANFQGTPLGRAGQPASEATVRHLQNSAISREQQNERFELLRSMNREQMRQGSDDRIEATLESFELAFRMQRHAPDLTEISGETDATKRLYGIGEKATDNFGRQCLLARRMAERGVRFIQVNYADNGDNPRWDQHSNLPKHAFHAKAVDRPVAGLLADLESRGLLEDTLVWWGGEFGRNPFAQDKGTGRDHNPDGFSVWLAGGGVKPGYAHGETDEFGHHAVVDKVHMHDLHATVLWLLGMDHERLSYRHAGRDFRLTDVYGQVVHELFA